MSIVPFMRPKRLGIFSSTGNDSGYGFAPLGDDDFLAFTLDFIKQGKAGSLELTGGDGLAFHMAILTWSFQYGHIDMVISIRSRTIQTIEDFVNPLLVLRFHEDRAKAEDLFLIRVKVCFREVTHR